ncbi:MAG: DUF1343 domain-containing protein [Proteobacteria bacterium]|nr:DUF1343 domain-containing protein [Pseudomonadota bacterium]
MTGSRRSHIRFGADRVAAEPSLLGPHRGLGLVTNDAARLAADPGAMARLALQRAGVPLVRLFGPEHGMGANAADGAPVEDSVDPLTGLPVVSLYGERMRPTPEQLDGLDAVLFDVPDVGARFYTYVWTLFEVGAACADAGVPLIVLDRPNPLGGQLAMAEGPILDLAFASFIGGDAIPIRHALTIGELARLWQRERWNGSDVRVIACEGWRRELSWPATGLEWVPTSPSMPSAESALLYPGICLFEATNLSVGRGTDAPFQRIGAPWIDAARVLDHLSRQTPRGVRFERERFTPSLGPWAGEGCEGIRVTVTDARLVRPVALGLFLLAAVMATHRLRFAWARYPTAANPSGQGHFERLIGRSGIRARLDVAPDRVDGALVADWTGADGWADRTAGALLYD